MKKILNGEVIDMGAEEETDFLANLALIFPTDQAPSAASIYATAKFIISDDQIEGVNVSSRFSGAFKADIGSYWIFFTEPQPDTNYIAQAFDGGLIRCYVKAEDYGTDFLVITTTDLLGIPADPTSLSLIITRVN